MEKEYKAIRLWLTGFIIILFLSGLTAMPVETELSFLSKFFSFESGIGQWIDKVYAGFQQTNTKYPFLAYGYDWLAFAHFILAGLFIGPLKDPVRNKWIIEFGLISCILIIPFACIAGYFRDIPLWWRMIDCSFGIIGLVPLTVVYRKIIQLEIILKNAEHDPTQTS